MVFFSSVSIFIIIIQTSISGEQSTGGDYYFSTEGASIKWNDDVLIQTTQMELKKKEGKY